MNKTFDFSKELQIILYGVNVYTEELCQNLLEEGYQIKAIFDRRYKELVHLDSVRVYSMDNNPFLKEDKSEYCVIIMLQNAMQHERIARELVKYGYTKILFIPMNTDINHTLANKLRYCYNAVLLHQYSKVIKVPITEQKIFEQKLLNKYSIIKREGEFCIVWLPAEIIYTNPLSRTKDNPKLAKYANVPLMAYFPYVKLFQYLQGNKDASLQYLDEYGKNSCKYENSFTDREIVIQRNRLLEIYAEQLNYGMGFFIASAPLAEWNAQEAVFNLLEGQHRSLFLLMHNLRYIPIRITVRDYEIWKASHVQNKLGRELKGLPAIPILNPAFKKINEGQNRSIYDELQGIQQFLDYKMLKKIRVLDISCTYGYFARNAARMQAMSVDSYITGEWNIEDTINEAEGITVIQPIDDITLVAERTYDTIFIIENIEMVKKIPLSNMCQRECFIIVKSLSEKKLCDELLPEFKYQHIKNIIITGQMAELCVYSKGNEINN